MKVISTTIFILFYAIVLSQNNSINKMEEIVLKGSFSPRLNVGYKLIVIHDSILKNQVVSLGDLLQKEANLYFKQNGYGMVSSISLRGTNASQTGVYWNGIAINSTLNGQTDFNTLSASSFDGVEIRKGGASVLLGSGAIGGAINLRDKVIFQDKKKANLLASIGSYQTYKTQFNGLLSNDNLFGKISFGGVKSENDYPYFDRELKNENGQFKNYNVNGVFGLRINAVNQLTYFMSYIDNDRNTSRTLTAKSKAKLKNKNYRNLIDWKFLGNKFTSSLKFAFLSEEFTYFFDRNLTNTSEGKSNNFISKYDFNLFLKKDIFLSAGISYRKENGEGSNIEKEKQKIFNGFLLFHQQLFRKISYNLSIRKGYSNVFEIPFIYAIDAKYKWNDQVDFKLAFSTNYRNPTFNDLYWQPGGNPNLKSEKSKSAEIGVNFKNKIFQLDVTSYYIKSKDLIQWRPVSNDFWQPINIQEVINYGLEFSAFSEKNWNNHKLQLKLQYDYVISQEVSTKKQLIYVPIHKGNALLNYQIKKWNFNYNLQYVGEVFTTTTNTQAIDAYLLSDLKFNRNFLNNKIQVTFNINNLFNKNYQSVAYRPMPNRNYSLQINLNI